MRIDVKGRNFTVDDQLRERVGKRFEKIARQVSETATRELELSEERNPSIPERCIAEGTLYLKGHRDKRRGRRGAPAKAEPRPATP
jgi:putative sigma-54 modulation protein